MSDEILQGFVAINSRLDRIEGKADNFIAGIARLDTQHLDTQRRLSAAEQSIEKHGEELAETRGAAKRVKWYFGVLGAAYGAWEFIKTIGVHH